MKKVPNDQQLEKEIISRIMFEKKKRLEMLLMLKEDYFYNIISRRIFKEIVNDNGTNLNGLKIKLEDVGITRLTEWTNNENFVEGRFESKVELLKEIYAKRKLNEISLNIQDSLEDATSNNIITSIERKLIDITSNIERERGNASDVYREYLKFKEDKEVIIYGLEKLDAASNGHKKGQIWVVGGESGIGKTFFALNVMVWNIMREKRVLFFSTELIRAMLFERLMPMFADILDVSETEAGEIMSENNNMLIYDTIRAPEEIFKEIKRQKIIGGVDLVIIDHIQDIEIDSKAERVKELESICNLLKDFAIKEKVAILITSQLNDQGLFRDSRKIKHMATLALLLVGEKDDEGNYKDLKYLVIDKNRIGKIHGKIGVQMDRSLIFRQAKFDQ